MAIYSLANRTTNGTIANANIELRTTATERARVMEAWLFALARNKLTQTATTQAVRNDTDAADIATAATSDDGTTATRGEWA